MGVECQSGLKFTDTALSHLQALTLDAVGLLTDLLEKIAAGGEFLEDTLDLQVVQDAVQTALYYWGMPVPSSQYIAPPPKSWRSLTKT